MTMRIGNGFDVHRFSTDPDRQLVLGGVLSSTLVPLFISAGEETDDESASVMTTVAFVAITALTLLALLISPLLNQLFATRPEVFAHNVETVPRIFRRIRPGFSYTRSLDVLSQSRTFGLVTKSNLILGMGETRDEISQALRDLHSAGAELITITQYLRPSVHHHPIDRWVTPQEFDELAEEATAIGFVGVLSGPLVRSSYRAGRLYRQAMSARASNETRSA